MFNFIINLNATTISLLIFLLFFRLVSADIKSFKLYNDSRHRIHVKDFCFSERGHVSMSLKSFSIAGGASVKDFSRFGFLTWQYIEFYTVDDGSEVCQLDSFPEDTLTLSNRNHTIPIKGIDRKYNIFFENCAPHGTPINLEVELEAYNLDKDGKKNYLREWYLPSVLFVFSLTYVVLVCCWVYQCYRNKPFLHKIHALMTTLFVVKCATMFIAAGEKRHVNVTGKPHGWKIWLYVFHVVLTVLFWTVIMLIGTGWGYMKPLLQRRDKIMLGIGVAIQVIINTFYIFLDETERFGKNYMYWFYALMVIDLASFVVAAVLTIWFYMYLKELAKEDGEAARSLQRMKPIGNFVLLVYFYGIGTRLWPWLMYRNDDFFCVIETSVTVLPEICSAVVYGVMFYLLRPMEQNEYYVYEEEEIALETIEREFI